MFPYLLGGVTDDNFSNVLADVNKIGRLISAPDQGVFMALIFAGDEESARKLLQPTLSIYKLTVIKANISQSGPSF